MDRFANHPIRDVSLRELLEAMAKRGDDEVFRFHTVSTVDERGIPAAIETLQVTFGAARRELGLARAQSVDVESSSMI